MSRGWPLSIGWLGPTVTPSHGGPVPQVTGGARGWADAFPEDTVADHVGDTRGRRFYRHLSDDEDLVASGGEGTPGLGGS